MTTYHIEYRTPETDSGATDTTGRTIRIPAGPWTRDERQAACMAFTYDREDEARERAADMQREHPDYEWRHAPDA